MKFPGTIKVCKRKGAIAVMVAVSLSLLLGYAALSLEGGQLHENKRKAQATADAAAMAAASVLYENYPQQLGKDLYGSASSSAYSYAAENGFPANGADTEVTVYLPPVSGPYKGMDGYVEVLLTYYQDRSFSRIFGSQKMPVRARAVARGAWTAPNIGIIVLDYTGKGTLSAQGNGAFTETGAPVIVNSNNSSAMVDTGNGKMIAPEFRITGGYISSGNGEIVTQPVANQIFTGVHPTPDPLAYLPVPQQPSSGTVDKSSLGSGKFHYTLGPGTHTNLPNFGTGDKVTFKQASAGNGGVYYIANGGITSTGATIEMDTNSSGGMMIYNAGTGTNDKINITGNSAGSVNITPITSGVYTGMTFFQNRTASQEIHIEGNGTFNIKGTIYAANAELQAAGKGTLSNIGSQYVTRELQITGNGNVGITWNPTDVARTRIITLVE